MSVPNVPIKGFVDESINTMKLVIDCLIYEFNKTQGYEQYLHNLLNYFHKNIQEFVFNEVVLAVRENQVQHFDKYLPLFRVKQFKVQNILSQMYMQNVLKQNLKLTKNDVILFTCGYASLFRQCKSVLVVFDLQYLHYPKNFIIAKRIQKKIFLPAAINLSDKIIAISNFTRNDLLKRFKINNDKVITIYPDCNFAKFDTSVSKSINEMKIFERFILGNDKYFLSVSSLAPNKNVILLIKAFIEVTRHYSNYYLILVGSYSKIDPITRELIKNEGIKDKVIFTDYISNYTLGKLYEHCSAFVLPTKFEGFGMPIAEALYFNVPVIVTDNEICREIAGEDAIYIDCENPQILINSMNKVILGSIKKRDTKNIALEKYSLENTSGKYIELLNKVALE